MVRWKVLSENCGFVRYVNFLEQFPEFIEFRNNKHPNNQNGLKETKPIIHDINETPVEILESSFDGERLAQLMIDYDIVFLNKLLKELTRTILMIMMFYNPCNHRKN